MNGKFIVLYGINNLGKSTQAKKIVAWFKEKNIQAEYLKYPLYDLAPSGPMLNSYLREGNPYDLTRREAQLLYVMNRFQFESSLKEKLEAGITIIAEDYKGTGMAWGIGGGVDEAFMKKINENLLEEDIALYFDGERFTSGIESNHKHETDDELTRNVRKAHQQLAKEFGWIPIKANETEEEVFTAVIKEIETRL